MSHIPPIKANIDSHSFAMNVNKLNKYKLDDQGSISSGLDSRPVGARIGAAGKPAAGGKIGGFSGSVEDAADSLTFGERITLNVNLQPILRTLTSKLKII